MSNLINNKVEYVSINTVISDFYEDNDIKQKDIDESLLLKWAEDKINDIPHTYQLKTKIAWLDVSEYRAEFPKDLSIILEIAYKKTERKDDCAVRGYQIVQYVQDTFEGCELELNVKCPACHKTECNCHTDGVIVDVDRAFQIANPQLYYDQYRKVGRFGYGASIYDERWKILGHTDSDWFGLNKVIPGCANLECKNCPESYRVSPPNIDTSFEKGELLVSYMGRELDADGNIMIPKHRDVFEAVLQYLTYKYYMREFKKSRDSSDRVIYQEAKVLCDEATRKATTRLETPSFDDFSKFWSMNKWTKMDSAYDNLVNGGLPLSTVKHRHKNIYKS